MVVNQFCFTVSDPTPQTFIVDFRSGYMKFRVQSIALFLYIERVTWEADQKFGMTILHSSRK